MFGFILFLLQPFSERRTHLVMQKVFIQLATLFGIGKIGKAPGTMGTLATIPLVIFFSWLGPYFYMGFVLLLAPLAVVACSVYEKNREGHDHKEVVIDEVLGFMITMIWLPMTWQSLLIGFALFRLLDITKPLFIGYLDKKVQGGLGVVVDDVAAGIIASLIMQFLYTETNWLGVRLLII